MVVIQFGGCPPPPPAENPPAETTPSEEPPGGEQPAAPDGAALYSTNACAACHGADACGDVGPKIRATSAERLDTVLRDPETAHLPGPFGDLSDDEVTALTQHLSSLTGDCPQVTYTSVAAPGKYARVDMATYHDPTSKNYIRACTACHGDRLNEAAAYGDIPAAHSVMPGLLGSDDARCLTCHGNGVDFVYQSTSRLRADLFSSTSSSCASDKCHGASGWKPFYVVNR
jgi:cytochrome c553